MSEIIALDIRWGGWGKAPTPITSWGKWVYTKTTNELVFDNWYHLEVARIRGEGAAQWVHHIATSKSGCMTSADMGDFVKALCELGCLTQEVKG